MAITSDQLRSARALLKLEQKALAEATNVPVQTLKRYEGGSGPVSGNGEYLAALEEYLTEHGVTFLYPGDVTDGGYGVRLTKKPVSLFKLRKMTAADIEADEKRQSDEMDAADEAYNRAYFAKFGRFPGDEE